MEEEINDRVKTSLVWLSTRWVIEGSTGFAISLFGQRLVHLVVWEAGHLCTLGLSSGPPGGRPHARLKAGTPREAPTPAPTTSHRPHNSDPTPYEGRNNAESTNLQNHWRGGLLLLVGCLTSQQHASVSQGRICSDNFTCCHTEIEVADPPTFHLTQSQYTDTGPTSPSADPIMPGAWQGSH